MTTEWLHDDGEEAWPMKLHLGNGGIYLEGGYINCDINGKLASDNLKQRIENTTTIYNYYARLEGDADHLPTRRQTVCDLVCDVTQLPYKSSCVDKIVAIQVFEHFTPTKAIKALNHWHDLLWLGQPLVMSVPDMDGTLDMLETDPTFAMRHLRGRTGDVFNTHHAWYTKSSLCELLEFCGFMVEVLPSPHFYPAICVRAVKQ